MARIYRIAAVLFILLVPALMFYLFRNASNKYKPLPYLGNQTINNKGDTVQHRIPSFSFTDQFGKPFGSEQLKGNIYAANFFFTRCPSICPVMTNFLKDKIQDFYRKVPEVHIVSFTLDPDYDTPEKLKDFADKYNANGEKWHFLNGPRNVLFSLMNQDGFLVLKPEPNDDPAEFVHTEVIVLVDKEGHIRGTYNGTDEKDMERLRDEIRVLQLSYD